MYTLTNGRVYKHNTPRCVFYLDWKITYLNMNDKFPVVRILELERKTTLETKK